MTTTPFMLLTYRIHRGNLSAFCLSTYNGERSNWTLHRPNYTGQFLDDRLLY